MVTTEKKRRGGPIPSGKEERSHVVSVHMTPTDAAFLTQLAEKTGIGSRSGMIAGILERLILCQFSAFGAARMAKQIQDRLRETGEWVDWPDPSDWFRKPPSLEPLELTAEEVDELWAAWKRHAAKESKRLQEEMRKEGRLL